jgi:hypothetical protein
MLTAAEFDIQKEAAWALSNATSGGTAEQIWYLVQCGAIPPLCSLLHVADVKVVTVALEGLENMLKAANQMGQLDRVVEMITDCGGAQAIEDLQTHDNKIVYQRALKILEHYLGAEEEDDDALDGGFFQPSANNPSANVFGLPMPPPNNNSTNPNRNASNNNPFAFGGHPPQSGGSSGFQY